jgi:hypothetical protein
MVGSTVCHFVYFKGENNDKNHSYGPHVLSIVTQLVLIVCLIVLLINLIAHMTRLALPGTTHLTMLLKLENIPI